MVGAGEAAGGVVVTRGAWGEGREALEAGRMAGAFAAAGSTGGLGATPGAAAGLLGCATTGGAAGRGTTAGATTVWVGGTAG